MVATAALLVSAIVRRKSLVYFLPRLVATGVIDAAMVLLLLTVYGW